ncbi:hypothetical protein [Streptomyces sp. NPDC053431]|uniref:hypothetical protein n=1 Tax=Streptomyces sp. NPDC053431 TaxID=3365703 RepID=UPI0037D31DA2
MTATSEELRPLRAVRPAPPPWPVPGPPADAKGGRTEQFVLTLTGLLPLVYEQAWQTVLGPGFRLETVDWRATRAEVQDARLAERLARESAVGLPLDRAQSVRATLVRRDERTWTFAWRYPRELMDRRAGLLLLDRAAEAYGVLLRGGTPPAPPRAGGLLAARVGR